MKKKNLLLALSAMTVIALLASCSGASPSSQPATLRLAFDYWPGYYPALIAIEKGYFAEDNLTVTAIKPENTNALMADFLAGKYDMMAVSLGDVITLTQTNSDIYFLLIADESAGADAVLANNTIQSVEDLRGKSIGTNLGGFGEFFISTYLKSKGVQPSEVSLVQMDAAEAPAKLKSGALDAASTWEPYVSQAVKDGNKVLFTSADTPGLIPDGIVIRGAVVREKPEAVQAFVKNWFRAVDYWKQNPQEGNAAAAKQLGIDPSEISLEGIKLHDLKNNQALFTDDGSATSIYPVAKLYVDFFITAGKLTTQPDIKKLFNTEFVLKAAQ